MNISKQTLNYLLDKYSQVRYARSGIAFRKPKHKQIDPMTIPDVIDYFEIGHVQGYFLRQEETLYVIFIGSNQIIDWAFNFWFRLTETPYKESGTSPDIQVHKGFYRSYLKAREFVLNKIKDDDSIVVFGQSLGAAIATLAALDIQYNYPEKDINAVLTGAPKVGNMFFTISYNNRISSTYRFVYGNDIVTRVPPRLFGYRHVSHEIPLGPKKQWWKLSISDHMIKSYIPGVIEWEEKNNG
jgi:hypothetical protein